jgi:hypothetical protein
LAFSTPKAVLSLSLSFSCSVVLSSLGVEEWRRAAKKIHFRRELRGKVEELSFPSSQHTATWRWV